MDGGALLARAAAATAVHAALDAAAISFALPALRRRVYYVAPRTRLAPAVAAWILLGLAIALLAAVPGSSLGGALARTLAIAGASYGVYEATNLALLDAWPVGVALLDVLWGTAATQLAACAAWYAGAR